MKLLFETTDYNLTIKEAIDMNDTYNKSVIFHCYWNGRLNEKHYYSIKSCYYFNINKKKSSKIILWIENNIENEYNNKIKKYAEIKLFSLKTEKRNTFLQNNNFYYNRKPSFYSDVVRYILLYKYGGCWFDLDCLFLRSFDPLFYKFENEICVYQWENQNYPNGAIYISLEKESNKMKKNIEFIIGNNKGWGFQEAKLTYDLPLDILVLPCSWFDSNWIDNPYKVSSIFTATTIDYNFSNFFPGAFCFHWHNKWADKIEKNSIIYRLIHNLEIEPIDNLNLT